MEPLAVLVVSPDPLARSGLAALVAGSPGLELAGEVGPREAAEVASRRGARAVVWDVGAATAGLASERWPELGVPVLALAADPQQAGEALRAGARAVLARDVAAPALASAVAAMERGLLVLDPALAGPFVRPPEASGEEVEPLTPREREVLALLSRGLANKAIGQRLGISEHTAKFHVNAILRKLGVESRAEAIIRAARLGLVVL
jgi:two-component system nitrate/nitrite response regulator NarL